MNQTQPVVVHVKKQPSVVAGCCSIGCLGFVILAIVSACSTAIGLV